MKNKKYPIKGAISKNGWYYYLEEGSLYCIRHDMTDKQCIERGGEIPSFGPHRDVLITNFRIDDEFLYYSTYEYYIMSDDRGSEHNKKLPLKKD